ncbi:hypothetical protein Bca4012_007610 [Brassica carinata]
MALLYISHSDETVRMVRIQRVQQGIEENKAESSIRLTKITNELDKGKGHVFSYQDHPQDSFHSSDNLRRAKARLTMEDKEEDDTESSASRFLACSEPVLPTGFRLGPSSEGRVSGTQGRRKAARRRPSSWKRKTLTQTTARKRMVRSPAQGVSVKKRRITKTQNSPRRKPTKDNRKHSSVAPVSASTGTQPRVTLIPASRKKGMDFRSAPPPLP